MKEKERVLCVDDEPINLLILKKVLEADYHVLTADSGEEGLEVLDQNPEIQLVISDMKMPGMNGLEFIVEASRRRPEIAFFMLSGYSLTEEIQEALESKLILEYFEKPANFDRIKESLRKAAKH